LRRTAAKQDRAGDGPAGRRVRRLRPRVPEAAPRQGLRVELVNTAGSVDNSRRIIDGKADVVFAKSGTCQVVSDPEHKVSGLAAIYYEAVERLDRMDSSAAR
jgi:TRAP-type uncharacterized transport system substrate-binding protein